MSAPLVPSILRPMPKAPTAAIPVGLTADGAARAAWQPDAFLWVAVWRLLVVVEGLATLLTSQQRDGSLVALAAAGGYALVSLAFIGRRPAPALHRTVLLVDLAACAALLALAPTQSMFALLALYSYSTVVLWAAGRPIDAFIAGGIEAAAYTLLGLFGPYAHARPAAFVSNLALYGFFALAVSGFFTVARRIGALEIATEMSKERGRYRRDLHDRLGQALSGLHFELQAVQYGGLDDGTPGRLESLANGYGDARQMLADLFRDNDEPLLATNVGVLIQQEAKRMAAQTGTRIHVVVEGEPARIPAWIRPHVWSVSGECMNNAIKNGFADQIDIDLSITSDVLVLGVSDDGVGFDCPPGAIPEKSGHYGLREMAERARLCGGEVAIVSAPGMGTRVRLQIPLQAKTAADDILERDASTLRRTVWHLFALLRLGLGLVALGQIATGFSGPSSHWVVRTVMGVAILVDILTPVLLSQSLYPALNARPRLLLIPVAVYTALFALALGNHVPAYFMVYAPVVLLAAGVHGGRRAAAGLGVAFAALLVIVGTVLDATDAIGAHGAQTTLLYVTNLLIICMCATQGAKLLDRLEALQIRVRYQAIARLRQGVTTRMKGELIERLDTLERDTRHLSAQPTTDAEQFAAATGALESGSRDLKARLREIVHQLADPTPGRTAHP